MFIIYIYRNSACFFSKACCVTPNQHSITGRVGHTWFCVFAASILYKYRYLTVSIYCNPRTPGCIGTLETFIWIYFLKVCIFFFCWKSWFTPLASRLRDQVTPNQCSTLYYSTGLEKPHILFFLVLQLLNMNIVLFCKWQFLKKMYTAQEGHKLLFLFCMNICMRKSISSAYKSNLNIISKLMHHVYWATGQVIVCALLIYFYLYEKIQQATF